MQKILVRLESYAWKITTPGSKKKKNKNKMFKITVTPSKDIELLDSILRMLYIRMMLGGLGSLGDYSCTSMDQFFIVLGRLCLIWNFV